APILLIHGANDPRCPVYEVEQLVEKLRVYGKKYKIKIYEDEGHSIRKEVNRIDMYRRIVSFLNEISSYDALKNT
ncbi:MAG: prolyl oligopeptidase family serine peptidase, partial [Acidilobaceae archaeon]